MISRRQFAIGAALMAGDGLVRPLNAPAGGQVAYGIPPNSNGIDFARVVVVFGPAGTVNGVFVYTPGTIPGPGSPPIAALTASNTDLFGNSTRPGDATPGAPLIVLGAAPSGGTASYVELVPGNPAFVGIGTGDPAESAPGEVVGVIRGSGPGRAIDSALFAPRVTGQAALAGAQVLLESASPDLTIPPDVVLLATDGVISGELAVTPSLVSVQGAPLRSTAGTAAAPTLVTTDTWHAMALGGGYTGTARYMLKPDNTVMIESVGALATNGTVANGTQIWTAPAGYVPAASQQSIPLIVGAVGAGSAAAAVSPFLLMTSAGALTVNGIAAQVATTVRFTGSYALD